MGTPTFLLTSLILLLLLFSGCSLSDISIDVEPITTTTTIEYPEWTEANPGIALKQVTATVGQFEELFTIARIDPQVHQLRVAVDEEDPKTMDEWQVQLNAQLVVNGSYFDENYQLTTRTVTPEDSYGPLLTGSTGIARTFDGQDWVIMQGDVLQDEPQNTTQNNIQYSIQSYPLLINGQQLFTGGSDDIAARTVLALDERGMVYIIVAERGVLTLDQLANTLATLLNTPFTKALNLDGGTSTGLSIESGSIDYFNSSVAVPSILYIP